MMRSLIEALVDSEAQIGAIRARQAMLYTSVTEVIELQTRRLPDTARKDREMPLREALSELAAGLRMTERTVQRRMSDGTTLLMRFTRTCAALAEGRISPAHVAVILEAGSEIDDDEARGAFEMAALDVAEIETAGRLRSVVRSLADEVQPTGEHCRFPGCRQPAHRCDVDHTHDAALGGETQIDNLAHLCRRHHTLKHATHWQVRQLGGGTLEWTSPTGLVYIDVPSPTLRFPPRRIRRSSGPEIRRLSEWVDRGGLAQHIHPVSLRTPARLLPALRARAATRARRAPA